VKHLTQWLSEEYARQPYVGKVNAALAAGKVGPGVTEVFVQHDDDCPLLAGSGLCDCDPAVRMVRKEPPCCGEGESVNNSTEEST
jgi:hypothetical protein